MEKQMTSLLPELEYDVFISCKSEDYGLAETVYNYLKDNGFKVFLSSRELRRMKDAEFLEAISKALDTSYHLLVFSSSPANVTSKFVKFEWTTFLNEILSGRKAGQIMTLLTGMEVKDLPIQLRHYESFTLDDYQGKILQYAETPYYLERKEEARLKAEKEEKERNARMEAERKKKLLIKEIEDKETDYRRFSSNLDDLSRQITERRKELGEMEKRCPVCDEVNPIESLYCRRCGWTFIPPFEISPKVDKNHLFAARSVWNDLKRRTDAARKEADELKGRIAEMEGLIEGLEAVKKELETENAAERGRVKAVESKLSETENLRMESERVSAGLRETIDEKDAKLLDGKEQIARKDGIIAQLGEKCSKSEAEIQRLSKTISENDVRLREEKKQTATKDELIKSLNEKCGRMESELEKYKEAERRAEAERIKAEQAKMMMALKSEAERKANEERAKKIAASFTGHDYVDLDLPSGTLWATCNVGASKPSDYGDYFAWGETGPKNSYEWENLKYRTYGDSYKDVLLSKYVAEAKYGIVDNRSVLEQSDDAAHAQWGGVWRMPTREEWVELHKHCDWKWTNQDGRKGYRVTSKENDSSIFLPAAGWRDGGIGIREGDGGFYWSSSLCFEYSYNAFRCAFDSDGVVSWSSSLRSVRSYGAFDCFFYSENWGRRCYGLSVRPVASSLQ